MKQLFYFFAVILLLSLWGCNKQKKIFKAKYVVDINDPINVIIDDFIYDIDTIRLEVTDESLMKNIEITHIMDERLYILTNNATAVHIFDLKGKYIAKINDVGQGPKEYIKIHEVQIDPVNNRIIITDNFSRRILIYNKDGKQTDVFNLNFHPSSISPYKDGYINSDASKDYYKNPEMDNYHIHFLDSTGLFVSSAIEKENNNEVILWSSHNVDILRYGDILYHPKLSNVVYKIFDGGIVPYYEFNNRSKYKIMTDKEMKDFEYEYGKKNTLAEKEEQGYLLTWGGIFDMGDFTLFIFKGWMDIYRHLYYNKKTSKTYFIDPMITEEEQYTVKFFFYRVRTVYDERIYVAPSDYIINEVKGKINISDKKISEFLNNTNFDSNPLLVSFKLKFPE